MTKAVGAAVAPTGERTRQPGKMLKKHILALSIALALAAAPGVRAQTAPEADADRAGFYGGVALRSDGGDRQGVSFGHLTSVWSRFAPPVTEDSGARSLAYGGYRWANDLAVEASIATAESYALRPATPGARSGVGLALAAEPDATSRAWNVDVFGTWEFRKRFSLYGRLGYAQSEAQASYAPGFVGGEVRRPRDGVNYGLGLRYDMSPALGLRLEYARFGRLPGDLTGVLPENDQLQFGLQFRF